MSFRVVFWFLAVAVPVSLTFLAAGYETTRNLVALTSGTVAFTMMGANLILAMRLRSLDALLGGLDKVYALHRQTGIAILVLAIVHTQLRFQQLEGLVPPGSLAELAVTIAQPAFYALVVLGLVSVVKRLPTLSFEIPWAWWKWSHRLMGPIFVVIALHQLLVKAPFESTDPIRLWTNAVALAGVGAWLWTLVMALLRRRTYVVESVEPLEGATRIRALPKHRGIKARPGQFAFLSAARPGLREPHPFTLSAVGADGAIEVCVQPVGDFTRRLRERLQPGDALIVEGGYGRFSHAKGGPDQVWLAGGIGITPFLALAQTLETGQAPRNVLLVHAVRNRAQAFSAEQLKALSDRVAGFVYHLHVSAEDGRIKGETVMAAAPFAIKGADLLFCGPSALRKAIVADLTAAGHKPSSIHFERFEFR